MMTNQEAIKVLGQYDVSDLHFYTTDGEEIPFTEWSDAIEIAISALQAQDVPGTNDGDLISRQAAIDAAIKATDDWDGGYNITRANMIEKELNDLPSAQPEPSIPISWIEKQIAWLKSMDNEFSSINAMNISVLVKKWRKENGKDDGSD